MHDYYSYSMEELARNSKIPVYAKNSSEEVFRIIADIMADTILEHNREGRNTVFIVPVGPVGQYPFFVERVNRERISLKNVYFFNMDEYMIDENTCIPEDHRLSFRRFMNETVYSKIDEELNIPSSHRFFPIPETREAYTETLRNLGGPDICFGGIGINGHVAFNEADPSLTAQEMAEKETRTLKISAETVTANAIGDLGGAIEDMPRYASTVGMKEILSAKKIVLGVFRPWHRAVVRRASCGEVSAAFPVTLLQNHPDAMILVNDVASAKAVEQ